MADQFTVGLNLMDGSFNLNETRNYGLAVFFGETHCTFCILDHKRNKFLGLQQLDKADMQQINTLSSQKISYPDFLNDVFTAFPWLKGSFKQVKIAYEGKKSTLVPAPLFDPDEQENYIRFNFRLEEGEQVLADRLLSMDSYQIYTVPALIKQSIANHFPGIKVVHSASVLIESISINYKNRIDTPRVFLHMCNAFFDLMIFDGRQMLYFNTFPFQNADDVAYYLIFVLEQLNFNPEAVPLVLFGNVGKGPGLVDLLYRYVRHVEFGRRNEAYKYSYMLDQVSQHSYFPLLNFFSCGL